MDKPFIWYRPSELDEFYRDNPDRQPICTWKPGKVRSPGYKRCSGYPDQVYDNIVDWCVDWYCIYFRIHPPRSGVVGEAWANEALDKYRAMWRVADQEKNKVAIEAIIRMANELKESYASGTYPFSA
jgi:hypothetical protein